MSHSGISRRMATLRASHFSGVTTHVGTDGTASAKSSGQENTSFSEPTTETLCLFGENTSTTRSPNKKASNARCSETKPHTATKVPSLSDRLTPLLMSLGLIKGTTPKSARQMCGVPIRAFASLPLDGKGAE